MATFKHEREECRCLDKETNIRIFWLDIENPGRAYAYLSPEYVTSAANQFHRYGILEEMELPSPIQTPRLGLNVRHLCWEAIDLVPSVRTLMKAVQSRK
jgi:hypothetical protein